MVAGNSSMAWEIHISLAGMIVLLHGQKGGKGIRERRSKRPGNFVLDTCMGLAPSSMTLLWVSQYGLPETLTIR